MYSFVSRREFYMGIIGIVDDGNIFECEWVDFCRFIDKRLGLKVVYEFVNFLG